MFKYLQTFYTIYCRHTYAIWKLQYTLNIHWKLQKIKKKTKLMSNIEFFNNYIFNFVEYHNVEDCVKSPTFL